MSKSLLRALKKFASSSISGSAALLYVSGAALTAWTSGAGPASAQAIFQEVKPDGRESASPAAEALARIKAQKTTRSVSVVRIDDALLRDAAKPNLELNLRPNLKLDTTRRTVQEGAGGRFVWKGEIVDKADGRESEGLPAGTATIIVSNGNATGTIQAPDGKLFKLQPIGGGQNALIEFDPKGLPPEHPPGGQQARPKNRSDLLPPAGQEQREAGRVTIDLVVAYTKNAEAEAFDVRSSIDLAVEETNDSFANSGINARVRVVRTVAYSYPDTDVAMDDILNDFAESGDGRMDSVHALRDKYGGDVAVLIVSEGDGCGIARDIGADASTAYVVVKLSCATGNYSFGHEIGHLAGARHDLARDPTDWPFPYSHGFQFSNGEHGWRTIMAYPCDDGSCPRRIQY